MQGNGKATAAARETLRRAMTATERAWELTRDARDALAWPTDPTPDDQRREIWEACIALNSAVNTLQHLAAMLGE